MTEATVRRIAPEILDDSSYRPPAGGRPVTVSGEIGLWKYPGREWNKNTAHKLCKNFKHNTQLK